MSKSVFISFAGNDRHWVENIKSWNRAGYLGPGIHISAERNDFRSEGDARIKRELTQLIQGASVVLFLVGQDTHNRYWVDYEVMQAQQRGKRILAARIPNTTGGKPTALSRFSLFPLDPSTLRNYL
ncbi:MAG: TIR domain-containing protein [Bacteroidota bacterium]